MNWNELPAAVRRDVLRHAKQGQRHPDVEVAAAAFQWAVQQPASRGRRTVDLVVEVISGVFTPGSVRLDDLRERLVASRVAALGRPRPNDG